jgi:hypothetical protein
MRKAILLLILADGMNAASAKADPQDTLAEEASDVYAKEGCADGAAFAKHLYLMPPGDGLLEAAKDEAHKHRLTGESYPPLRRFFLHVGRFATITFKDPSSYESDPRNFNDTRSLCVLRLFL